MPVFECSRKVQRFGSSMAMTLPSIFVKVNEVKKGSVCTVYYGFEGVLVISVINEPETLREGLMEIIEKIDEKYPKNGD